MKFNFDDCKVESEFMRVCVTGATGFIGTELLSELLKENFDVCSVVRSSSGVQFQDIDCIKVDSINANTNLGNALKMLIALCIARGELM